MTAAIRFGCVLGCFATLSCMWCGGRCMLYASCTCYTALNSYASGMNYTALAAWCVYHSQLRVYVCRYFSTATSFFDTKPPVPKFGGASEIRRAGSASEIQLKGGSVRNVATCPCTPQYNMPCPPLIQHAVHTSYNKPSVHEPSFRGLLPRYSSDRAQACAPV